MGCIHFAERDPDGVQYVWRYLLLHPFEEHGFLRADMCLEPFAQCGQPLLEMRRSIPC